MNFNRTGLESNGSRLSLQFGRMMMIFIMDRILWFIIYNYYTPTTGICLPPLNLKLNFKYISKKQHECRGIVFTLSPSCHACGNLLVVLISMLPTSFGCIVWSPPVFGGTLSSFQKNSALWANTSLYRVVVGGARKDSHQWGRSQLLRHSWRRKQQISAVVSIVCPLYAS